MYDNLDLLEVYDVVFTQIVDGHIEYQPDHVSINVELFTPLEGQDRTNPITAVYEMGKDEERSYGYAVVGVLEDGAYVMLGTYTVLL